MNEIITFNEPDLNTWCIYIKKQPFHILNNQHIMIKFNENELICNKYSFPNQIWKRKGI